MDVIISDTQEGNMYVAWGSVEDLGVQHILEFQPGMCEYGSRESVYQSIALLTFLKLLLSFTHLTLIMLGLYLHGSQCQKFDLILQLEPWPECLLWLASSTQSSRPNSEAAFSVKSPLPHLYIILQSYELLVWCSYGALFTVFVFISPRRI